MKNYDEPSYKRPFFCVLRLKNKITKHVRNHAEKYVYQKDECGFDTTQDLRTRLQLKDMALEGKEPSLSEQDLSLIYTRYWILLVNKKEQGNPRINLYTLHFLYAWLYRTLSHSTS